MVCDRKIKCLVHNKVSQTFTWCTLHKLVLSVHHMEGRAAHQHCTWLQCDRIELHSHLLHCLAWLLDTCPYTQTCVDDCCSNRPWGSHSTPESRKMDMSSLLESLKQPLCLKHGTRRTGHCSHGNFPVDQYWSDTQLHTQDCCLESQMYTVCTLDHRVCRGSMQLQYNNQFLIKLIFCGIVKS